MKYPYDLARRLNAAVLSKQDPPHFSALMAEAIGCIELMAELLTMPERAPAKDPMDDPMHWFDTVLARPEKRCKCGLHALGNAAIISDVISHTLYYCR